MQSRGVDALNVLSSVSRITPRCHFLRNRTFFTYPLCGNDSYPLIFCEFNEKGRNWSQNGVSRKSERGKDNVWSVDNEIAKVEKEKEKRRRSNRGKRVKKVTRKGDRVMVSDSMLMEVETVLQTQEPVILPVWDTFASSCSGIWKGVGAVFSPITAEMEPIDFGSKNENLYDCYTESQVEAVLPTSGFHKSVLQRKIKWITLNSYGEAKNNTIDTGNKDQGAVVGNLNDKPLPKIETFDFRKSDVMDEDVMGMEPGLVFFEDGSYSRGPVDIPVSGLDESNYYLSPTFKFEQCLVKGCHKTLRVVHTIEFGNGGLEIQIMRVAVYEDEWVSPSNIPDTSVLDLDLKPFSQRKRIQPSDLTGSWKVFEISATPIYGEETLIDDTYSMPYVFLCSENLKRRNSPENLSYFGDEETRDMQDVTVLWLPGGVTAYVDVAKDGILCVGVGWYSEEGINLVMERDYGLDGKLKEIRWKTELKRRWSNPPPM